LARPLVGAVVSTAMLLGSTATAGAAPSAKATTSTTVDRGASARVDGDAARSERSTLLLRIAELTDDLEGTDARVVQAQLRQQTVDGQLAAARGRMRERAVQAYVTGTASAVAAMSAPSAYLDIAARKEREVLGRLRVARSDAQAVQHEAEKARRSHRTTATELDRAQAKLEATIADADARQAAADAEMRAAAEARRRALAEQAAARSAARARALGASSGPIAGLPANGSYNPSPLDPDALVPRHARATRAQAELMKRYPFGPLAAGDGLPVGLRRTGGQVVGPASWYGPGFDGRPTASGAIYDQEAWTVASKELPLGTFLVVAANGRRVLLLVNDRGPYVGDRVLDLSHASARALGISGVSPVTAEVVTPV
jgi:hypothetical protein